MKKSALPPCAFEVCSPQQYECRAYLSEFPRSAIGLCSGTNRANGVQVIYDPQEVQYEQLLDTFFQHVDPTTKDRQGGDRGTQYRSAIYCHTPEQKAAAQKVSSQQN